MDFIKCIILLKMMFEVLCVIGLLVEVLVKFESFEVYGLFVLVCLCSMNEV